MKKAEKKSPSETPAQAFFRLFRSNGRAYGTYDVRRERAQTVHMAVTEHDWERHLIGKKGIGLIPIMEDNTCAWGAIDVDTHGRNAVQVDLIGLSNKVAAAQLPLWVFRSRHGGAHLILFLKKPQPAGVVIGHLRSWAGELGLPRDVEVFPKQSQLASNGIGNWLNMPYFDGNCTNRFCVQGGKRLTLERFLQRVNPIELPQPNLDAPPPCLALLTAGKIGAGHRNTVLFNYGIYLRRRFPDEWESYLHDFSTEKCDPRLQPAEITTLIKSLKKLGKDKGYHYQCGESPLVDRCNKDVCGSLNFGVLTRFGYDTLAIGSVTKVLTKPPTWVLDVNGETLHLETVQLQCHRLFKLAVFEAFNMVIPNVKTEAWDRILAEKLKNLVEVDPPDVATESGLLWESALKFCQTCTSNEPRDVVSAVVFIEPKGKVPCYAFRFSTLYDYLRFHGFRLSNPKELHFLLKERGARCGSLRVDGKPVSGVYKLPIDVVGSAPAKVSDDLINLTRYYGDV